jgi:protein TonB
MFENVMLAGVPNGKRVWTTCAGVTGQMLLVAGMAVAPMMWPEAMPPAVFAMLAPTAPRGPAADAKPKPEPKPQVHAAPPLRKYKPGFYQPTAVPGKIEMLKAPEEADDRGGPLIGIPGGSGDSRDDSLVRDIIERSREIPRPKPVTIAAATPPEVVPIRRVKEGGRVSLAHLVYSVDPVYPALARAAHIEGVVKLRGVIAVDGHITELALESGHPLLAPAALAAVRQWRYAPTKLNDEPVEVVTAIEVTFRLNR